MKSEAKYDGIDYPWALKYLAMTMTPHEKVDNKIQGLLPRRKSNHGNIKSNIKQVKSDEKEEIQPRNLIVGSLDVKALYSNINTKVAAEKVRD